MHTCRDQSWTLLSSNILYLIPLAQGLSLKMMLALSSARLSKHPASAIFSTRLTGRAMIMHPLRVDSGDWNSGLYVCAPSTVTCQAISQTWSYHFKCLETSHQSNSICLDFRTTPLFLTTE